MRTYILISILSTIAATVQASPRTSANYSIATETTDRGGRRATSANYTNDGSAGGVAGISTVAVPVETAKHGYLGQLYEVTGLVLNSAQPNVNEGTTLQLAAWQLLDDGSFLAVNANAVLWSVVGGPLTGISAAGLASAGVVYQNTSATAHGAYQGNTATLNLTVLDTVPDNFGTYAGDGVGDGWQVQYFGLNNPLAGPGLDPDGDGQTNSFEFTAGLTPTDPQSRFTLGPQPVPGQPTQRRVVFSPIVAGRTYVVETRSVFTSGAWAPLTGFTQSDNGATRTITDLNASGPTKFYRVTITKP